MNEDVREVSVTAYPYASVEGTIKVPATVEDVASYIAEHFNEICFSEPQLDFCGTEMDIYE